MNINPKVIAGVITSIIGLAGTAYACCKKSSERSKTSEILDDLVNEEFTAEVHSNNIVEDNSITNMSAQTEAEFINTLNAIRLNKLFKRLSEIDCNQKNADAEIAKLKAEIEEIISTNRGWKTGMHGFIGESAQVHIANIKSFIKGEKGLYVLLDDNSMTDYTRGIQLIQQKACQSDNHLGLDHIKAHMEKYPEFVAAGGIYQIPKDFYKKFVQMKNLPQDVAMKLRKEDLKLWRFIHKFIDENPDVQIEQMEVTYDDIQAGNIDGTIKRVENKTEKQFDSQRKEAQTVFGPSVKEFVKIVSISAFVEGAAEGILAFITLALKGKRLTEFDIEDRVYIIKKILTGFVRGGVRAGTVYVLTNFCKISSTIATTVTSAVFTCIKELYRFIKKETSKAEFYKNMLVGLAETLIGAIGAYIGKHLLKKNPILGALLGSGISMFGTKCFKKVVYA